MADKFLFLPFLHALCTLNHKILERQAPNCYSRRLQCTPYTHTHTHTPTVCSINLTTLQIMQMHSPRLQNYLTIPGTRIPGTLYTKHYVHCTVYCSNFGNFGTYSIHILELIILSIFIRVHVNVFMHSAWSVRGWADAMFMLRGWAAAMLMFFFFSSFPAPKHYSQPCASF